MSNQKPARQIARDQLHNPTEWETSKSEGAECPFCDTSRIKSVVNDYGDVIAFEPLNPVVKGHLLVVPKKHVTDFTEDIDVTARVMQQAALIAGYLGGSYNLITSKGREATQSVFHLHVHLVPRTPDDSLTLPWTDISHQRQQAYAEGYKQGSFDKEADLELGVVRQQAVAEFAREVVDMLEGHCGRKDCLQAYCTTRSVNHETAKRIHTLLKERGIEL